MPPSIHAALLPTALDKLVLSYPTGLDLLNHRRPIVGALDAFKADSSILLTPDAISKIENSVRTRSVHIPVLEHNAVSIINERSCIIACGENESNLIEVTFAVLGFTICQQPSFFENNHIGRQADFNLQLERGLQSFALELDLRAVNTLENNKNTFWSPDIISKYTPSASNALQVPQLEKTRMYNNMRAIYSKQNFKNDMVRVIAEPFHSAEIREQFAQGTYNSTNLAYQFGGYSLFESNNIVNGAGVDSTAYAALMGTLGIYNRNPYEARKNERISETNYWTTELFPLVDMPLSVYYKRECSDVDNAPQSIVDKWEITTDIAFTTSYISNPLTNPRPIHKYVIQE